MGTFFGKIAARELVWIGFVFKDIKRADTLITIVKFSVLWKQKVADLFELPELGWWEICTGFIAGMILVVDRRAETIAVSVELCL